MSVSEFHSATNLLNEVRYADLVSYAEVTSDSIPFIPPFLSISYEKVDDID